MAVSLKSTCFLHRHECFQQQFLTAASPSSQKHSAVVFRSTKIMASLAASKTVGISETFARLKEQNKVAFIPYITAGDPDLSVTAEALKVLDSCGSDIIELGLPYSDPLADGPVIQAAATRALARGTDFNSVLSMLRKVVPELSSPIALFSYYNPILKRGIENFMYTIKDAGVHGNSVFVNVYPTPQYPSTAHRAFRVPSGEQTNDVPSIQAHGTNEAFGPARENLPQSRRLNTKKPQNRLPPRFELGWKDHTQVLLPRGQPLGYLRGGLVVPDVPLEETEILRKEAIKNNIELVLLTTPTTPVARMKAIVEASEGFVYLVSAVGVTGARASVSSKVQMLLKEIKEATKKPVAVGFGISKPEHVAQVVGWGADGVIVGSAMVKLLGDAKSPEEGLKELELFTKSLKASLV